MVNFRNLNSFYRHQRFKFTTTADQLACTTNLQTPIVTCYTRLLTLTMLKTPFHFLISSDFDLYVVMSLTFPANQRKYSSSSRTVATLTQLGQQLNNALKQPTNSQSHKRRKRKRTKEYRSHPLFTQSTYLSRTSIILKNFMTTKRIFSLPPLISFKRNKNKRPFS